MSHISLLWMFTLIKTGESVLLDSLANNPLTLDLDAVITGAFLPENMATHVMQNTINYMVTSLFWGLLIIILVRKLGISKHFCQYLEYILKGVMRQTRSEGGLISGPGSGDDSDSEQQRRFSENMLETAKLKYI